MTKKMNWHAWNEEKAEYQEAYEKNQKVDPRDMVLHTEKGDLWFWEKNECHALTAS